MIDKGIIASVIVHFYTIDQPDDLVDCDYKTAYDKGVVNNTKLNKIIASLTANLAEKYKILVLLERQEHFENIEKQFEVEEFDDYAMLTGKDKQEIRLNTIKDFTNGELSTILASKILDEGVTMPSIDVVIRGGCMKTNIKSKQQVGRGQGAKQGKKNEMHVIDFLINTNKYLANHSKERFDLYHGLGYKILFEKDILTEL